MVSWAKFVVKFVELAIKEPHECITTSTSVLREL